MEKMAHFSIFISEELLYVESVCALQEILFYQIYQILFEICHCRSRPNGSSEVIMVELLLKQSWEQFYNSLKLHLRFSEKQNRAVKLSKQRWHFDNGTAHLQIIEKGIDKLSFMNDLPADIELFKAKDSDRSYLAMI